MVCSITTATARRIGWLLPAWLVMLAAGCVRAPEPATPSSAGTSSPLVVDVVHVVERPLDVQLSLPGELTAFQSVAVLPRVSGFVKTIAVDRGAAVRAGDVLATIDAPELVAQRAEAQSRLEAAGAQLAAAQARADADRGTFERLRAASATSGVVAGNDVLVAEKAADASGNQVTAARQQVEAARQAVQATRELEGYLRITAPFAGVVTERHVHPGALVGPSMGSATPMLRLVDRRRLRLVVAVPEAYTAAVDPGASLLFTVSAHPGTSWSGTVARIAQSVDVTTRTMAVELDVANDDGRLSPGMFCEVQWPVRRTAASLFVPSTSVASTTDRTFVVRVRGGTAEWVTVRPGLTAGTLVEVFGELRADDEVAIRGTDELRPGTAVVGAR